MRVSDGAKIALLIVVAGLGSQFSHAQQCKPNVRVAKLPCSSLALALHNNGSARVVPRLRRVCNWVWVQGDCEDSGALTFCLFAVLFKIRKCVVCVQSESTLLHTPYS